LPASMAGAREYVRVGMFDRRTARLAIVAGLPAVVLGALTSRAIGGEALLVLSGLVLFGLGVRMVAASGACARARAEARRDRLGLVIALVVGAGFVTGLLANGGGFLLVPIFVVILGFTAARAAGTSLVAAAALTVPTLIAHWLLGDIDWAVASAFALGLVPSSLVGARLGRRMPDRVTRPMFGAVLMTFATVFLVAQVV
jgi:uncharacterized membrane protein YfcA